MKYFRRFIIILLLCNIGSTPIKAFENYNEAKKIILIDPGHGGFDGGTKSKSGTVEKDINLDIALKLRDVLEEKGYQVYMTRENDESLNNGGDSIKDKKKKDLKKRCDLKVESECDVFISIHQNSFPQSKYYGAQVWYASNDVSKKLAENIQLSLRETIDDGNKRECKSAGEDYRILRDNYEGACVLVECGFLSNPEEDKKLNTNEHQMELVNGITLGIDKYFQVLIE